MMRQLLISAWDVVFYSVLDLVIYTFVDLIAKGYLKDVKSDEDRGLVWLCEAVSLALLCAPIWWISHKPVVLLILAIFTFIYTQLVCRVDFGYWWNQLTTRWEEFQSVEQLQESSFLLNTQPAVTQNNGPQQLRPSAYPPSMVYYEGSEELEDLPAEPWYPDEEKASIVSQPKLIANQNPAESSSCAFSASAITTSTVQPATDSRPAVQSNSNLHLGTHQPCNLAPIYVPSRPLQANHVPNNRPQFIRSQSDLQMSALANKIHSVTTPIRRQNIVARRGIHSPARNLTPKHTLTSAPTLLKSKLLSALGFASAKEAPPGLCNRGQNLCFMNSVLQCIAKSPNMIDHLYKEDQTDLKEAALTTAFRDTMKQLSVLREDVSDSLADSWKFRQAASCFKSSILAHPSHGTQEQQDAAEFLMWLLGALHTALNVSTQGKDPNVQVGPSSHAPYNSMTLTILKFIYGDLNTEKIERLKKTFKQEIEYSSSLAGESSDESIQRLADLEWLTYKQTNNSIINNLFTGQLIEAQRCIACDHISVNIQTFNILPVPIVEPNPSGLVYLEDCFDKFSTIENLIGLNGLNCGRCKLRQNHSYRSKERGSLINSTLETVMSPIPKYRDKLNDSGFQDNQHRTSTPIRENVISIPSSSGKLTDGQKRSLLRQLPECLVIQLLRFTYENKQVQKVHRRVSIPMINLDLSKYTYQEGITSDTETLAYNLYAMCVHTGANSTLCGHYVSYVEAHNGVWYKYDDEHVTEVNMEYKLKTEEVGENAYLLFYKRNQ